MMTGVFGRKLGGKSKGWRYDNHIPSEPDYCATIVGLILVQLENFGWNNKDTFGIHMAMEEAIMNAIRHGNGSRQDKEIHVQIEIGRDMFFCRVTDQGIGFDPVWLPDPTAPENLGKSNGRGIMLIKNFIDSAVYNEKGNSLEMKKRRSD